MSTFNAKIQGQLRHLMTFLGPIVTVFLISENPEELVENLFHAERAIALVGLLIALLGFIASWFAPEKKTKPEDTVQGEVQE